jgi:galactose oxidase-like protein
MRFKNNRTKYYFVGLLQVLWTVIAVGPATAQQTWTQLSPSGGPPPIRESHTAVFDPGSNRMIVFGGTEANGPVGTLLNDVWVLTNADGTGSQ